MQGSRWPSGWQPSWVNVSPGCISLVKYFLNQILKIAKVQRVHILAALTKPNKVTEADTENNQRGQTSSYTEVKSKRACGLTFHNMYRSAMLMLFLPAAELRWWRQRQGGEGSSEVRSEITRPCSTLPLLILFLYSEPFPNLFLPLLFIHFSYVAIISPTVQLSRNHGEQDREVGSKTSHFTRIIPEPFLLMPDLTVWMSSPNVSHHCCLFYFLWVSISYWLYYLCNGKWIYPSSKRTTRF